MAQFRVGKSRKDKNKMGLLAPSSLNFKVGTPQSSVPGPTRNSSSNKFERRFQVRNWGRLPCRNSLPEFMDLQLLVAKDREVWLLFVGPSGSECHGELSGRHCSWRWRASGLRCKYCRQMRPGRRCCSWMRCWDPIGLVGVCVLCLVFGSHTSFVSLFQQRPVWAVWLDVFGGGDVCSLFLKAFRFGQGVWSQ